MKIETLIKCARSAGVVHRATSLLISKVDGKWNVHIMDDVHTVLGQPHGRGPTPDDAIQAAVKHVREKLEARTRHAKNEASEYNALLQELS